MASKAPAGPFRISKLARWVEVFRAEVGGISHETLRAGLHIFYATKTKYQTKIFFKL